MYKLLFVIFFIDTWNIFKNKIWNVCASRELPGWWCFAGENWLHYLMRWFHYYLVYLLVQIIEFCRSFYLPLRATVGLWSDVEHRISVEPNAEAHANHVVEVKSGLICFRMSWTYEISFEGTFFIHRTIKEKIFYR